MRKELFLPAFALKRPVTTTMIFIALLVVGVITYVRIPVAMEPGGFQSRRLSIRVNYGNASPVEVERVITRPVEDIVRTMSGIESIESYSRGSSYIRVSFKQNTDMAEAYNQLRDRMDRVMPELPDEVRRIEIRMWDENDRAVMGVDFRSRPDAQNLHALMEEHVKRPLEALDGVAHVDVHGTRAPRVEIQLSRESIEAYNINVYRLISKLRGDNFAMSAGWVRDGSTRLLVRSDSRFTSLEQIRNYPIPDANGMTLKDIGTVRYLTEQEQGFYHIEGTPGVWVSIKKLAEANTVEVCKRISETLHNDILQRPQMAGFEPFVYFSQGKVIKSSLDQLQSTGLWGGFFAILVLLLFLRRVKTTLVIAGAIPFSIMVSMSVVYFSGWSLNLITMLGLIIGFGIVVDNSIVVVEAIYARRAAGQNTHDASLHGAGEVGLAITVSTMTTLVVFLPLIFMSNGGDAAFVLARLGMPVIYALLASLVVALLFIPLSSKYLLSGRQPKESRIISWMTRVYGRGLRWMMNHRLEGAIITLALVATIQIPMGEVSNRSRPVWRDSSVYFNVRIPRYYPQERMDSIMVSYEQFMLTNKEKYGISGMNAGCWNGGGWVWAPLKTTDPAWYESAWNKFRTALGIEYEKPMTSEEVIADLRENAPRYVGVRVSFDRGGDQRSESAAITLFGDNTETLVVMAREVERRLRRIPEVTEVDNDIESNQEELRLSVNRDLAQQYGVTSRNLAHTVSSVVRGADLESFQSGEREIPLRLELDREDRRTLDQVLNLTVEGDDGAQTTVNSLVGVTVNQGMSTIRRENGRTRVRVTARSTLKNVQNFRQKVTAVMTGFQIPRGYQWSLTGQFAEQKEEDDQMQFAIILAIVLVFFLMGVLFESFILPLSVIIAIPMSFLGVYWILYLADMPMDQMAYIGVIVLIGVVVNNAIVLVDLVNRLRSDGMDRFKAILEAGRQRLRPIVMTSATTIFGLAPVALGDQYMGWMKYSSLGTTMIGGLVTSTFLTLFVVPLFYTLLDDVRVLAGKVAATARSSRKKQVETINE